MERPRLLITHDGQFHADELFTIALIHFAFGAIPYERRRKVTPEELKDPTVWVLDQYGEWNATKGNFDHHQDKALPATNVLVLLGLEAQDHISKDLLELLKRPFAGISDYDVKGPTHFNGFQTTEFIRMFNNYGEGGFELALSFIKAWLGGVQHLLNKKEAALLTFKNGRSIEGLIRVCKTYPILWTTMGTERLLVCEEKGKWMLHSADTLKYPIKSTDKAVFIHQNRFIATYESKDNAIEAALATANLGTSVLLKGYKQ